MKYSIGDIVKDEDGNTGTVIIKWNDGDWCDTENDAAHPGPVIVTSDEGRNPVSSTPTRKESHDQWENRQPVFWNTHDLDGWVEATKQWLREEPQK